MVVAADQPGESLINTWLRPMLVRSRDAAVRKKAGDVIDFLKLGHVKNELAGNLSGGQKKLLEISRALMLAPKLILLDEPTAGVSPLMSKTLGEVIARLRAGGLTLVIIEHDMDVIAELCSPIYVLAEGRTLMSGTFKEVVSNRDVMHAYLGKVA
jgi:branched-chain amino acid transport system ATP-binding protein